jgi:MYXO-CTERM domain-containing protein
MLFLRVAADAGGHEGPADATQRLASFGMENGSATYALLKGGTLLVKGTDYDTDDDGTLELPGGVTIVDSLGVLDNNNAGDRAYGSAVLARSTGEMDGATRICTDRTPSSVTAWYGGKLPSGESSALVYDPTKVTANAPAGARLTPGAFGCVEPPDGGDAGDADAGDANDNDGAESDAATASLVRLSEIKVNPPKDDGPWEFIEIACTPSARLRDHSLVVIEGDSRVTGGPADGGADSGDAGDGGDGGDLDGGDAAMPTDVVGTADLVLNLDGVVCGSNGIVLLAKPGGHEAPAGAAAGTFPGSLENGTATFLLVKGAAGRITSGTDYDSNDDGTLELPAGTEIVDSVAIRDNEADARVYGPAVVGPNFTPDAVSRYCSEAANSGAAWLGGDLVGEPSSLAYDPARSTSNRPSGFLLTPGAPNPCGADGGTTGGATGSTTGSGGTSGGVTGATGGTTSPDGSTDGGDEVPTPGSCSCRAAGVETSRGWAGLAALLGGLAVLRRRRRRG